MTTLKLLLSAGGIYACFLTWGLMQERVTTTTYPGDIPHFKYFIVLNLVQSLAAALVGFLYLLVIKGEWLERNPPIREYAGISILHTLASPFGYASLKHIDYPTMILAKSSKLIPVMLMSFVLHRVRFPIYKYICVALVTIGVAGFTLMHNQEGVAKSSRANSFYGLSLLMVNLLIDGATNSTQDQVLRKYPQSNGHRMMVWMNILSASLMVAYLLSPFTNELSNAIAFLQSNPSIVTDILVFGLCGALGQCFVFYTLEHFGSLILVTVTVTRKMFSMILSVAYFRHSISIWQWASVAVVFMGIGLEAWKKSEEAARKKGLVKPVGKQSMINGMIKKND